jgi:ABC-type transport system involved in multi-copper enzyme maturation permease subunit
VRALLTVMHLTLFEAMRRRILLASAISGAAFLLLFGTGLHFVLRDIDKHEAMSLIQRRMFTNFLTLAGLYATNFLLVMTAVLLPVDTLSGEIASGVIQTIASKPIARRSILLGKWAAYVLLVAAYLGLLAGGVLVIARVMASFTPPNVHLGLPLMLLEGVVLTTLSIAGGTRLSTVTNGVLALGLYGIAFIGSWVEQIGTRVGNDAARYVGTIASLIMPTESMWLLAAHHMQPALMRELQLTPFSPASVPSPLMVAWTAGYIVVVLLLGLRSFQRRPL